MRKLFEEYTEIENLWEILSPSPELRDHITTFQGLARLYAAVRSAYSENVGFVADLAYETRQLIKENATQAGLGRVAKSITFDVQTLESLEGEAFSLVRGLQKERYDDPSAAPVLNPLKDPADHILKDPEPRKIDGVAAIDLLPALATEKEAAMKFAKESGL